MTQSNEKEFFYVFVDTNLVRCEKGIQNIFHSHFFENLLLLRDFINQSLELKKEIQVILPDLVIRERYHQEIFGLQKDFKRFFNIFKDFQHPSYNDLLKVYENLPKIVSEFGSSSLERNKVKFTPPFDPKYLDNIISKAINHEAPFEQNDKGFKDSVIWYSIVEYVKSEINHENSYIVFFTNDKIFNFENLKKEFFEETGKEIQILKTGGDPRIKYYDPEFKILISRILRDLDTKIQLTNLEINFIKNIDEILLCNIKANPLPINFAYLIAEDLTINNFKDKSAEPIIKFLDNLNFDTKILATNIFYNSLSPNVTVYLRNYKQWFLDIEEIGLEYECGCILIESYPDFQYDIVSFNEYPQEFQARYGTDIAKYLEEKGYGKIEVNNVSFKEGSYVHYD
jgi:hypothetical protein